MVILVQPIRWYLVLATLIILVHSKINVLPSSPTIPKTYTQTIQLETSPSLAFSGSNLRSNAKNDFIRIIDHFMKTRGFSKDDYVIKSNHVSKHTGVFHYYLGQLVEGKPVFNGEININLSPSGFILSYGDSFYPKNNWVGYDPFIKRQAFISETSTVPSQPIGPVEALYSLLDLLGLRQSGPVGMVDYSSFDGESYMLLTNVTMAFQDARVLAGWIQLEDGFLEPVWEIQLDLKEDWLNAHISASDKKVVSLINWVSYAEYTAFPLSSNDPDNGKRSKLYNPADKVASPLGWHDLGTGKCFTDTEGNNVIAGHFDNLAYRHPGAEGGPKLKFDFPLNLKLEPDAYLNASITNLFYWCNTLHDLFYHYGFDEAAGNFQENNFQRGGRGGDALVAWAQNEAGYDNANFATPPDGQRPRMNMYVWDQTRPKRDGDLEGDIIAHEYTHGVSTRLTGGALNSDCLPWGESAGLGEGWGDFVATLLRLNRSHTRNSSFGVGHYVSGGANVRKYPYSTNLAVNPETYRTLDQPSHGSVHAKGATWAVMLYEVYWNLADLLPLSPTWVFAFNNDIVKFSNTLMLQLLIDGMKLQPCRPTFTEARDAILLAESILTRGAYQCALWKGFAKRGLGVNAKLVGGTPWGGGARFNSFDVPKACL